MILVVNANATFVANTNAYLVANTNFCQVSELLRILKWWPLQLIRIRYTYLAIFNNIFFKNFQGLIDFGKPVMHTRMHLLCKITQTSKTLKNALNLIAYSILLQNPYTVNIFYYVRILKVFTKILFWWFWKTMPLLWQSLNLINL